MTSESWEGSIDTANASFSNLYICKIDVSFFQWSPEEWILFNSGCRDWREYYSRTPSTRQLSPEKRYKAIMKRTSVIQFMDPSENAQHILDMDLFPMWEEEQKRKEDLRIRLLEKPNLSANSKQSIYSAAKSASMNLGLLASAIQKSVSNEKSSRLRGPLHFIPDQSTGELRLPFPKAYYARRFVLPKYTRDSDSDRYDPQAHFWKTYRVKLSKYMGNLRATDELFHVTSSQRPLSCSTINLSKALSIDSGFMPIFDYLLRDENHYPVTSGIQIEQIILAKMLLSVAARMFLAIIRGDLPLLLMILDAIIDIAMSLRALIFLDYNIRERCL